MEILKYLKNSPIVQEFEILDYKKFEKGFFLKVKCLLNNDSELYIREYFDQSERNYSYHWQNKTGKLLIRWDNSPHHKNIPTFPHHKHAGKNIEHSFEITLPDILRVIESSIDKIT